VSAFSISREVRAPAQVLWDLLVDWPRHGGWVPLTTVRVDENRGHGVGATLVGRTAVGPLGFDDVMRVIAWRPPDGTTTGRVRLRHEGKLVGGEAEIEVRPVTDTRCVVTWWEDIHVLPTLPARAAHAIDLLGGPATVLSGRWVFGRLLRRAADQAEQSTVIAESAG
jgi:Polyketide cyclase / dehydrase and lipid transport